MSLPYKTGESWNDDWVVSGSGDGSHPAGTHPCIGSVDGGAYLYAGSQDSSVFAFIHPRDGGRFDKIAWNTSKSPRMRVVLAPTAITQSYIVVGLNSDVGNPKFSNSSQSGSNRIEVFLRSSDSQWRVHVAKSTTSSSAVVTTTQAASAGTIQDIDIRVSSARIVTIYINGLLVYTSTIALAASKTLIPKIGIQTYKQQAAAGLQKLGLYHIEMSQLIQA
jgi:hypothetical protein